MMKLRCKTLPLDAIVQYEDMGIVDGDYVTKFIYNGETVLSKWPHGLLDRLDVVHRQREAHDFRVLELMGLDPSTVDFI